MTETGWRLVVLIVVGLAPIGANAIPKGAVLGISDSRVNGYAYEPDNPREKVQIHVYSEDSLSPVIGPAAYGCQGSAAKCKSHDGQGFGMQYRRVVNDFARVRVYALSSRGTVLLPRSLDASGNTWSRAIDPFYYENRNYRIGISRQWGAVIFEYFNKRAGGLSPVTNLIDADPGAAFQTALFGSPTGAVFSGNPCLGNPTDRQWNPTQAGNYCGGANHRGSHIVECASSVPGWCGLAGAPKAVHEDAGSNNWIAWTVRYRNFFYQSGDSAAYKPYDSIYGRIQYTFKTDYVQADYQIFKAPFGLNSYGVGSAQLPVVFLKQLSKFTTAESTILRNPASTTDVPFADGKGGAPPIITGNPAAPIGPGSGRWVTAEAVNNRPGTLPVPAPDSHLTLAFYRAPYRGSCSAPRHHQQDFAPQDQSIIVQLGLSDFEMFGESSILRARTLILPYRFLDGIPGGRVDALVNKPEFAGGLMPEWECNQANSPAGQGLPNPTTGFPGGMWPGGFQFGLSSDTPLSARINQVQIGHLPTGTYPIVFRPAGGDWIVNNPGFTNYNGKVTAFQFGWSGDSPFVSTLAGVGWCATFDCPIVYRPSTGTWYVNGLYQPYMPSNNPAPMQFGVPYSDVPLIVPRADGNHLAVYQAGVGIVVNTDNKSWHGNAVIWE